MERKNNYAIQAAQARQLFLSYDAEKLAKKLKTDMDEDYLYTRMLSESYRISRASGDISRFHNGQWIDANSFSETLTLLDLVCDSREDRFLTGRWKNTRDFGLQFHSQLLEQRNPSAEAFEREPQRFADCCRALGGVPFPKGDVAFTFDFFDGLPLTVQLWFGEEEFPAQLRYLWDENAKMYIRYETMYYGIDLFLERIRERMENR